MEKDKFIKKECKKHGTTEHVLEGRGWYRCKQCRLERVKKRRKDMKRILVEYKGGKCEKCGIETHPSVYEFHHLNPDKKDFGVSQKGYTRSLEKNKQEVDKCIMLCANCHRLKHAGVW